MKNVTSNNETDAQVGYPQQKSLSNKLDNQTAFNQDTTVESNKTAPTLLNNGAVQENNRNMDNSHQEDIENIKRIRAEIATESNNQNTINAHLDNELVDEYGRKYRRTIPQKYRRAIYVHFGKALLRPIPVTDSGILCALLHVSIDNHILFVNSLNAGEAVCQVCDKHIVVVDLEGTDTGLFQGIKRIPFPVLVSIQTVSFSIAPGKFR